MCSIGSEIHRLIQGPPFSSYLAMLVDPKVQDRSFPGPPGRVGMQFYGIAAPQQIHHGKQRTCLRGTDRTRVTGTLCVHNTLQGTSVDGSEIPNNHQGWCLNPVNHKVNWCRISSISSIIYHHIHFKGSWEDDFSSWWDMLVPRRVIV